MENFTSAVVDQSHENVLATTTNTTQPTSTQTKSKKKSKNKNKGKPPQTCSYTALNSEFEQQSEVDPAANDTKCSLVVANDQTINGIGNGIAEKLYIDESKARKLNGFLEDSNCNSNSSDPVATPPSASLSNGYHIANCGEMHGNGDCIASAENKNNKTNFDIGNNLSNQLKKDAAEHLPTNTESNGSGAHLVENGFGHHTDGENKCNDCVSNTIATTEYGQSSNSGKSSCNSINKNNTTASEASQSAVDGRELDQIKGDHISTAACHTGAADSATSAELNTIPTALTLDLSNVHIEYKEYESELQMQDIMRLIQAELSEPYSIYTYRYFIYNWPKLCFLATHGNEYVGAIVCKLDMHMDVMRGYIAMLAVRKEYRKLRIGTTLVEKAIEAMLAEKADEVVLETEMRNVPALRLYENLGFVRDKRLFRYYLNGVDALRLKLWFR